jgi:hypothetical protein
MPRALGSTKALAASGLPSHRSLKKWRRLRKVPTYGRPRRTPVSTLGPLCSLPITLPRARLPNKNPREGRCCRHFAGVFEAEAPVGVEPTMADLQSAALATWLRSRHPATETLRQAGPIGQALLVASTWPASLPIPVLPVMPKESAVGRSRLQSVLGARASGRRTPGRSGQNR